MKEAYLYEKKPGKNIECHLCRIGCNIPENEFGHCRIRKNEEGTLKAMTYGKPCAANPDPIEKKPLFHFLPGSNAFSIATVGCNFRCKFCQNWRISQASAEERPSMDLPPEKVVQEAERADCRSIAYTYTEPTVFYEYAKDTSQLAREKGLKNVFVSNGYMSPEMIDDYDELDAANVDIKGDEEFYRDVCGGVDMQGVLDSVKRLYDKGVHLEVTNLIVPGYNDDEESWKKIIDFVKDLDPAIPLHFTAFRPAYKMKDSKRTKRDTLVDAHSLAVQEGLEHVYCGNTYPGDPYENTYCPDCGELLIDRHGFSLRENRLENGKCPECGERIYGVF